MPFQLIIGDYGQATLYRLILNLIRIDVAVNEAAHYMYSSGYRLAGSHYLSRVFYLMRRHVETCVLD
uniref:DUF3800 domain-containing protein n=1 Tax=Strongyloides venezuelensis TaxID=75913 RepID=A0A0K0G607_STRVS